MDDYSGSVFSSRLGVGDDVDVESPFGPVAYLSTFPEHEAHHVPRSETSLPNNLDLRPALVINAQ